MKLGLLTGTDESHRFFYQNIPEYLIEKGIDFVLPEEIRLADLIITTVSYLEDIPKEKMVPIILLTDNPEFLMCDERIMATVPYPTDPDGFDLLGTTILAIFKYFDAYKRFIAHGSI